MSAKTSASKEITIDSKPAVEQTLTSPIKSMATYTVVGTKIMIISYYAAEKDFLNGIATYEDILNSIKFKS
jgi:hypothetical protein